jgi:hypothetical protein
LNDGAGDFSVCGGCEKAKRVEVFLDAHKIELMLLNNNRNKSGLKARFR